jgi:outer membrane biosynthesis protein TonB
MRQNTGNAALLPRQDEPTVVYNRGGFPAPRQALPAEGVTVCVPGAVLAPAPTHEAAEAAEAPVFVDDSGSRRRLLRIVGVLLGLLSISFLAVVGVALAVPSVATSVGLGDVVPFVVPGAAAPPPPKAPPAPRVQVAKPKPKPTPSIVAAPTTKPKPVTVAPPTTEPAPVTSAPVTSAPVTEAPVTQAPVTEAPPADGQQGGQQGQQGGQQGQQGGQQGQQGGQPPADANPPAADANGPVQ